jgi:hypothetical protein
VVVGLEGLVIVAVPETTVHTPVPAGGGLFPVTVVIAEQMVWFGLTTAFGGDVLRKIITSSEEGVHGDVPVIVQRSVTAPVVGTNTVVVGLVGLMMKAEPLTTDQVPVPTVGVFPVTVVVREQIFLSGPAFAAVGAGRTVTGTVTEVVHPSRMVCPEIV